MKLDQLAISIATTAVVSAAAVVWFRHFDWVVVIIMLSEAAVIFALSYLDSKRTQTYRKGTGFAIVSVLFGDGFVVEAATQPGHPLMLLSMGGFSAVYLFRTVQEFRKKPAPQWVTTI